MARRIALCPATALLGSFFWLLGPDENPALARPAPRWQPPQRVPGTATGLSRWLAGRCAATLVAGADVPSVGGHGTDRGSRAVGFPCTYGRPLD